MSRPGWRIELASIGIFMRSGDQGLAPGVGLVPARKGRGLAHLQDADKSQDSCTGLGRMISNTVS